MAARRLPPTGAEMSSGRFQPVIPDAGRKVGLAFGQLTSAVGTA